MSVSNAKNLTALNNVYQAVTTKKTIMIRGPASAVIPQEEGYESWNNKWQEAPSPSMKRVYS